MFALSFRQSLKTLLRFRLPFPARRGRSALLRFGQQWTAVEGLEVRALLAATFGGPNTITADANGARAVFSADVDGDGDLDVLSASAAFNGSEIAWYENDGSQNFTLRTISTSADGPASVFAADVDGDGDLDVLSASSSNNKIIWYENLGGLDFGDAPAPYPVLLSENGARHAPTGLTLGSNRDGEADGTHSLYADADGVDEAGVTLGTIRVGQSGVTISVAVSGSAGKLDAWIDFNGDGSWGGVGEQIFASQSVVVGTNNLAFDVPSLAVAGKSFARFRLSTAGGLTPTGSAADGEVEDYKVIVIPLPPTITGPSSVTSSLRPGITWTGVPGASNYEIWIKNQSTGVNPFHPATGNGGTYIPTADLGIGRFNLWMRSRGPDGADSLYTGRYNFTIQTPAVMHDPGPSLATHRPTLT